MMIFGGLYTSSQQKKRFMPGEKKTKSPCQENDICPTHSYPTMLSHLFAKEKNA